MNNSIYLEKKRLDYAFKLIDNVSDEETKSHLSRYLCVLVSGFIENSIKILLYEYANRNSSPKIVNYIQSKLNNIRNLNYERIKQILSSFSEEWFESFENKIEIDEKDALDSVIANKNNIAHGKSVGLTYVRIKDYYEKIVTIINNIDDACIK